MHGVLLRVIGTAFATLPSIQQLIISGYSQRLNPATGHVEDEYLISAKVERTAFEQINFDNLEEVDPIMAMERFELVRGMCKAFQMAKIQLQGVFIYIPVNLRHSKLILFCEVAGDKNSG